MHIKCESVYLTLVDIQTYLPPVQEFLRNKDEVYAAHVDCGNKLKKLQDVMSWAVSMPHMPLQPFKGLQVLLTL